MVATAATAIARMIFFMWDSSSGCSPGGKASVERSK